MPNKPVPADGKAVPKSLSDLFENPINRATRMASILQTLLENTISSDMSGMLGERGKDSYYIIPTDRDDILFAIYQLDDFIGEIDSALEEAVRCQR